jgi:outer membrane protein
VRRILLIFVIFFLSSEANATQLTLEDCITEALKNNRNLKAYEMDLVAAGEDVKTSQTKFLPSLHLKGTYTLLDKSDVIVFNRNVLGSGIPPQDVQISLENQTMYGLSLSVEQPVFTGGYLTHSFMKSKIVNQQATYRLERQRKLLVFNIKKVFYEALTEQLYEGILEKIIKFKKERLRVIKERNKEGYASLDDVLLAESDLSSSELDLYKTKNKMESALSNLEGLMYYKQDGDITLRGESVNGFLTASIQEVKESALQNRKDLKLSLARIKEAAEDIGMANSEFYPKISLEARYTQQKETNITRPEVGMLTGTINWTLFEWGRTKAEVKKAEALKQKLKYEYEEFERSVALEAEQAWRTFKEDEKEVDVREKQLRTAEYRFKQAMDRYSDGAIKIADLFEIESEFVKTYNEYLMAIDNLDVELAHLEVVTSSSVGGWFTKSNVYRPDLGSYSNSLKELLLEKSKKPESASKQIENIDRVGDVNSSPAAEDRSNESRHAAIQNAPFMLQAGSFKTKQKAESLRENLLKRIGDRRIKIYNRRDFYKVRIMGFKAREEAENFAIGLRIKDYLVVREGREF